MAAQNNGGLAGTIPRLAVGEGPPLVHIVGLTPTCEAPAGMERRVVLSGLRPLLQAFSVFIVNRKPGLRPGESMSDIAGDLAAALDAEFEGQVFLNGTSTGGSVALQLALDRPDLVRALVVIAAAHRLGPSGARLQRELADAIRSGDPVGGWARVVTGMMPTRLQRPARPIARVLARSMAAPDSSDLLVTIEAEDAFDIGDQLDGITAPTLVIGGAKDVFYGRELFERTAAGVVDGRAHIYPVGATGVRVPQGRPPSSRSASCSRRRPPPLDDGDVPMSASACGQPADDHCGAYLAVWSEATCLSAGAWRWPVPRPRRSWPTPHCWRSDGVNCRPCAHAVRVRRSRCATNGRP